MDASAKVKAARRGVGAGWLAFVGMLLAGCPTEIQGPAPFRAEDVQRRTEIARRPGTPREALRRALGAPWIASDQWRVDVFRLSGEQRIWVGLPLPILKHREQNGLTLVAYDDALRVAGASSLLEPSPGVVLSVAEAGDYELVEPFALLSVGTRRFLADAAARPDRARCVVLVACDLQRSERSAADRAPEAETAPVCWRDVRVDAGRPAPLPRLRVANRELQRDFLAPLLLPAGEHALRFESPLPPDDRLRPLEGDEPSAQLRCTAGEVWFARLVGEQVEAYSAGARIAHRFRWGRAVGRVELSLTLPPALAGHRVLLHQEGAWLLPEGDSSP